MKKFVYKFYMGRNNIAENNRNLNALPSVEYLPNIKKYL